MKINKQYNITCIDIFLYKNSKETKLYFPRERFFMITYKSSLLIIIRNLICAVFGSGIVILLLSLPLELNTAIIIGFVVLIYFLYLALISNNITIIISGDELSFYKQQKLEHSFNLNKVELYAKIRMINGGCDCYLIVSEGSCKQTCINCSMLGTETFYKLLYDLNMTEFEPICLRK